jgi:uncharacterized protein (DUF1015 family)
VTDHPHPPNDPQSANVGPVFLMYKPKEALDELVRRVTTAMAPETSFVADDGIEHLVWPISDEPTVSAIREAFERCARGGDSGREKRERRTPRATPSHCRSATQSSKQPNTTHTHAHTHTHSHTHTYINTHVELTPIDTYHTTTRESIRYTYIADGHHRSASAFRVGEMKIKAAIADGQNVRGDEPFCFFLAVLFPANQLKILEYNRVVKDLNGLTEEEFLTKVKEHFAVRALGEGEGPSPARKGEVGMCLRGSWYRLAALPEKVLSLAADPVSALDVQYLYNTVLAPVLGIGCPREDERIKYVGGIRGNEELQRLVTGERPWGSVAFAMYPVSVDEVMAIADAEGLMPPKATWFEPKVRGGCSVVVCAACFVYTMRLLTRVCARACASTRSIDVSDQSICAFLTYSCGRVSSSASTTTRRPWPAYQGRTAQGGGRPGEAECKGEELITACEAEGRAILFK